MLYFDTQYEPIRLYPSLQEVHSNDYCHKSCNYCHMFCKYLLNFRIYYPTRNHYCILSIVLVLVPYNMNSWFNILDIDLTVKRNHTSTLNKFQEIHKSKQYSWCQYMNIRNIGSDKLRKQKDMLSKISLNYKLRLLINMWILMG